MKSILVWDQERTMGRGCDATRNEPKVWCKKVCQRVWGVGGVYQSVPVSTSQYQSAPVSTIPYLHSRGVCPCCHHDGAKVGVVVIHYLSTQAWHKAFSRATVDDEACQKAHVYEAAFYAGTVGKY